MLDYIYHTNFYFVQLSIFSLCICNYLNGQTNWIKLNEYVSFYSSIYYKIATLVLLFGSFALAFIELKWWISIVYFIVALLIHWQLAKFFIIVIIPKTYFVPKLHKTTSDRFWGFIILLNSLLVIILSVLYVCYFLLKFSDSIH